MLIDFDGETLPEFDAWGDRDSKCPCPRSERILERVGVFPGILHWGIAAWLGRIRRQPVADWRVGCRPTSRRAIAHSCPAFPGRILIATTATPPVFLTPVSPPLPKVVAANPGRRCRSAVQFDRFGRFSQNRQSQRFDR